MEITIEHTYGVVAQYFKCQFGAIRGINYGGSRNTKLKNKNV